MTNGAQRIGGAAAIAALLLCACSVDEDGGDPVVARAYDRSLYWSDLRQAIPLEAKAADSAAMAQRYIDSWLHEQVVLHRAEENLTADQLRSFDARIEDYRRSLLTYTYEDALVAQKLDTTVTDEELRRYYDAHGKDFLLKDNIVRARWFKLHDADTRTERKVEQLWRSGREEDRHELEVAAAHGSPINDTHDDWMPFTELLQQVPLEVENPTDWLPRQGKVTVRDSLDLFFVELLEHRLRDGLSPFPLVRERVRAVILNQRRLALLERMRNDLYQDALDRKDIEVL